jgi:hypothetical protein
MMGRFLALQTLFVWLTLFVAKAVTISDPGQGIFDFTGSAPGLSGLTWLDGNTYRAVSDSVGSPNTYTLTASLHANGTVTSATLGVVFPLAGGTDNEGIAFHRRRGTLFVSDEGNHPSGGYVREFDRETGALINTLAIPAVMLRDRPSLGFEALTLGAGAIWIANEQALEHESHTANATEGSLIRLQRFDDQTLAPAGQWAYRTDPSHGAPDLVALPDGQLLVLERAFSFGPSGTHYNRIYLVDFSQATETSAIDDLDDGGFSLTGKTLLWEADMGTKSTHNFEGLALGPQLDSDSFSLLLIADNNSGSEQHLYPVVLNGVVPEPAVVSLLILSASIGTLRRRNARRLPREWMFKI